MTPEQFQRAIARTQLGERSRRCAYAILVEGVSSGIAAEREGVSRQAAHAAAQTVRRAFRQAGGYPASWQVVTVVVPPETAEDIYDMASAARRALSE